MKKKVIATGTAKRGDPLLDFSITYKPGELFEMLANDIPLTASGAEGTLRQQLLACAEQDRAAAKINLAERVAKALESIEHGNQAG